MSAFKRSARRGFHSHEASGSYRRLRRQGAKLIDDLSTTLLLQDCEHQDDLLTEAREYLTTLEADPTADELTLAVARHEVFRCKERLARH